MIAVPTISRHHALIIINDGALSIKDLDSKNGTYFNGQVVGCAPVMVTSGAQIAFGAIAASINLRKISTTNSLMLNMTELKRQVAERMSGS